MKLSDKRDALDFPIVNLSFICSRHFESFTVS